MAATALSLGLCFSRIPGFPYKRSFNPMSIKKSYFHNPRLLLLVPLAKTTSVIPPIGPPPPRSYLIFFFFLIFFLWSSWHISNYRVHFFGFTLVWFCLFWEIFPPCNPIWAWIWNLLSLPPPNAGVTKMSGSLIKYQHATSCIQSCIQKATSLLYLMFPQSLFLL